MEISLDAVNWKKMAELDGPREFLDAVYENEDDTNWVVSCYDIGWESDSAIQYFEVAECLKRLSEICNDEISMNLKEGLFPIISENSHLDEFGTAPASDDCNWISISAENTVKIRDAISRLDLDFLKNALEDNAPDKPGMIYADIDDFFIGFIKQHIKVIDEAVKRNYGLLGHCG